MSVFSELSSLSSPNLELTAKERPSRAFKYALSKVSATSSVGKIIESASSTPCKTLLLGGVGTIGSPSPGHKVEISPGRQRGCSVIVA